MKGESGFSQRSVRNVFLCLLICVVLLWSSAPVWANAADDGSPKKILDGLVEAYKAGGEDALREYARNHKESIPGELIEGIASEGVLEKKEGLLNFALILAQEKGDDKTLASVFVSLGFYSYLTSRNDLAMKFYQAALSKYEKLHDLAGQGDAFWRMGNISFHAGNNEEAKKQYEKALSFYEQAHDLQGQRDVYGMMGNVYLSLGDSGFNKGNMENATVQYEKALFFYEQANDLSGQGNIYRTLGDIALNTGKNEEAMEQYKKALFFYEQTNDLAGRGDAYKGIGDVAFYTGNNEEAMRQYEKALSFYERANSPLGNEGQGNVYRSMGDIAINTGNNDEAIKLYGKALAFYEKVNALQGEGNVYKGMGDAAFFGGKNEEAMKRYEEALHTFEQTGDPLGQGNAYKGMGNVALDAGDDEEAVKQYEKALIFYEQAGDPLGQGNVYRSMGNIKFREAHNEDAMKYFEKALIYYRQEDDPLGQGAIYLNLGNADFQMGNYKKAIEKYDKALPFFELAKDPLGQGNVYLSMGHINFFIGANKEAMAWYKKAYALFAGSGAMELEAYALFNEAKIVGGDEAVGLYDDALALLEKVRRQTGLSDMKASFMNKVYDFYEDATVFMLENKYNGKAFKFAESMKARVFLDQLAEGLVNLNKGIDPELKKQRDDAEARISAINKQIMSEYRKQKSDEDKIAALKKDYASEDADLEEIKKQIRLKNPEYASVQYPEPVTVKELQEKVLHTDEIMLEYFVSKDGVYCFATTKDGFRIEKLDITKVVLEKDVNELVSFLRDQGNVNITDESVLGPVKKNLHRLYVALLRPFEKEMESRSVIIVPDGELALLPFEVLKSGDSFAIEKYRIKYVQSASVLEMLREHYKEEGTSDSYIGFGDPVYDYADFIAGKPEKGSGIWGAAGATTAHGFIRGGYERAGGILNRLKGSGEEVKAIEGIFEAKKDPATGLLRDKAMEETAVSGGMERYGYIHFSAHGILDDKMQAIALSQIPGAKDDGFLTIAKIMNSKYKAKLVVLSACQTGLGKIERGEGVTGLTRAVMYAGTPAVVVSLWSVSDKGTKELMVKFYENMIKKNMPKGEALREAKLAMMKEGQYRNPFYWAAFVMYGE